MQLPVIVVSLSQIDVIFSLIHDETNESQPFENFLAHVAAQFPKSYNYRSKFCFFNAKSQFHYQWKPCLSEIKNLIAMVILRNKMIIYQKYNKFSVDGEINRMSLAFINQLLSVLVLLVMLLFTPGFERSFFFQSEFVCTACCITVSSGRLLNGC